MRIIQDPRQNQGNEKDYGVAYFENDFNIGGTTCIAGQYFYRNDTGNPEDRFNARFLPHGFPVIAKSKTGGNINEADITKYKKMFPNLIYNVILKIERDPSYSNADLNSRVPILNHKIS
jgi:hypothetical protein